MPISGLIITLNPQGPQADAAQNWLAEDARFEIGKPDKPGGRRLPATLDTETRDEDKQCWDAMQEHPGIAFVDVTCVFFEEDDAPPSPIDSLEAPASEQTLTSPLTQGAGRG